MKDAIDPLSLPTPGGLAKQGWAKSSKVDPATNEGYTDADPALTGDDEGSLYLAYKRADQPSLYFSRLSLQGKSPTWSSPAPIGVQSAEGPALAWLKAEGTSAGGTLYLFWRRTDGSSGINYGVLNPTTGAIDLKTIQPVTGAESGNGPAAVAWNRELAVAHTGKTSSSIYYNQRQAGSWKEYKPSNKKSNDAPALAANAATLFLFHRGEGTKRTTILWSHLNQGADPVKGWTKDEVMPEKGGSGKSKHRPGVAGWEERYVFVIHRGEHQAHLLWSYHDLAARRWFGMGLVGGSPLNPLGDDVVESALAPALWYTPKPKDSGKNDPSGMFLVYANSHDGSGQLFYTYLTAIPD